MKSLVQTVNVFFWAVLMVLAAIENVASVPMILILGALCTFTSSLYIAYRMNDR